MLFEFGFLISIPVPFSLLGLFRVIVLNSHFVIVENQIALDPFFLDPVDNLLHLLLLYLVKVFVVAAFEALCCPVHSFAI